ncbi:MAG TPA: cation-efflux pump, partial [Gammaproteobacteria bacterium]|nr:cation-efflux pump [Gammaproteobacteria bacterium]
RTEAVISNIHGVVNMHMLRTRKSGADAFADVHIQVPPNVSVSEGHQIAEAVRHAIIQEIDEITDVTVHTDPEDDAVAKPCNHLPLRGELLETLEKQWGNLEITKQLDRVNTHYLNGKIHLELFLPLNIATTHADEIQQLKSLTQSHPDIEKVDIFYY